MSDIYRRVYTPDVKFGSDPLGAEPLKFKVGDDEKVKFGPDPLAQLTDEERKILDNQARNLSDFHQTEKAKGPLIKLFNMAFPVETGVATDLALHEMYPEAMITNLILSGELDVGDDVRELLSTLGDDDIRIYPAMDTKDPGKWYGWLWTGKQLQTEKGRQLHRSSVVAQEKLLDQPLILEMTVDKEIKTKKKFFSGKEKEKVKGRTVRTVELPYTQRQVNEWLSGVDPETGLTRRNMIRDVAWDAFKSGITTKDSTIKKRLADGNVDIEDAGMVTVSEIMVPRGHPGWLLHRAASVAMSGMILEPFDLAGALSPMNQASPGVSHLDDVLGIWAKRNPSQALIQQFWGTKPGKAVWNVINNWTPTRWAARYFDWMPIDLKRLKSTFMHGKSEVGTAKVTIRKMGNELWNTMHAEAKKSGKRLNPIYNDKIFTNFEKWLHGGGAVTLGEWFKSGRTFTEFVDDIPRFAKILDTTPEKLMKYFTPFDERNLLRAYEMGARDQIRFLKGAQELGDAAIKKVGTTTNPLRTGYVLRDGTGLDVGFQEHFIVHTLKGIDPDDPIKDFLTRTGAAKIQVHGDQVTLKTAGDFTKEQVDAVKKSVAAAKDGNPVIKLVVESTDEAMELTGEKHLGAGVVNYVYDDVKPVQLDGIFEKATSRDLPWQLQQFEETFDKMDKLVKVSESMKLDSGTLDAKAVQKSLDEGQIHLPHRQRGQAVKKGEAFRKTDASIASAHRRIYQTFDDYEAAILQSGVAPEYHIIRVLMEDSEDAANELLQKIVETRAEDVGSLVSVLNTPGVRKAKNAWKIVEANKKYLDPALKITDDNVVDVANGVISSSNIRRVKDLLDEGVQNIQIKDAHKIDLTALAQHSLTERGYSAYFPRTRMKIFARNVRKEMAEKIEKLSPEVAEKMKTYLDEIGVMLKKGDLELSDIARVMEIAADEMVEGVAPKSVLSISRKTPMNLVSEDVGRFISQEVRTVSDQDVSKVLSWLSRRERGFMSAVTVYNPNFWRKYLMTDVFQLYKGGVKPWMIGARVGQGAAVLTGKGNTMVNGVKFTNREFLKMAEEAGVRRHVRQLMSNNNFNILSRFADDVLTKSRPRLVGKKALDIPMTALSHADDTFRLGLYTDRLEYLAKMNNVTDRKGMMKLMAEAAEWTWRHMFNYDDLPQALKKARALIPFLSWQRHIVPDMLKFALDLRKIKQIAKGHLAIQSFVGKPEVPLMAEYLKKSPEIMWKCGEKAYRTNLNLPFMNVLNFAELSKTFERMFGMLNPYLKIPLIAMNVQTFPRFGFYEGEKVAAPVSMYWAYKDMWNDPKFQKLTGAGIRIVKDEDDLTPQAYVTVSKKFYDAYHIAFPRLIPIDENTKNMKLFLPLEDIRYSVNPEVDRMEQMTEEEAAEGIMKLNIKSKPKIKFLRTRPGLVTREIDVNADLYRRIQRIRGLANTVEANAQSFISAGKGFNELEIADVGSINEPFIELVASYEELRSDLEDYPVDFNDLIRELDARVTSLQAIARDFLFVENDIHLAPLKPD